MSHTRTFTLLLVFAALCAAGKDKDKNKASDKPEGWLPVTQQDLAIKEVPNDPGAGAIQLYMSYYKDENANFVAVYKRIKVLREGALVPGRAIVDVEIPIEPGVSLKELAARTIHPDQSIVEYTGKPRLFSFPPCRKTCSQASCATIPSLFPIHLLRPTSFI